MLENSQKVVEVMEHSISEKMVYVRFCFLATEKNFRCMHSSNQLVKRLKVSGNIVSFAENQISFLNYQHNSVDMFVPDADTNFSTG